MTEIAGYDQHVTARQLVPEFLRFKMKIAQVMAAHGEVSESANLPTMRDRAGVVG